MKELLKSFHLLQSRIRYLKRAVRTRDAIALMLSEQKREERRVYLTAIEREAVIRLGTSDLQCMEKVFMTGEYRSPFTVAPRLVVDAGANIGMATLFFAKEYPDATIVAIEPEPSNYELLKKNCHGLQNVILIQAALWNSRRKLCIHDQGVEKWAFSVRENESTSGSTLPDVEAVTIPDILSRTGLDTIDILKLDIEGAEYDLFNADAASWLGAVKQIMIELHDRYRPGCARVFYNAICSLPFSQEIRGENIFINFHPINGSQRNHLHT